MNEVIAPQGVILTEKSATMIFNGRPVTIDSSQVHFKEITRKLIEHDYEGLQALVNPEEAIKAALPRSSGIDIRNGEAFYNGYPLNNVLGEKLLHEFNNGYSIPGFSEFVVKVMQNPSKTAIDELYLFMESGYMTLCEDGDFLAYKKVRDNFYDIHSGTMDNSPGNVLTMQRNQVDDNRDRTCSNGLHFCSYSYLRHFGGAAGNRVVLVKINPADVVAIPSDYQNAKGRTCRYEVIQEVEGWVEEDVLRGTHGNRWVTVPERSYDPDLDYDDSEDSADIDYYEDLEIDPDFEEYEDENEIEDTDDADEPEVTVRPASPNWDFNF